MRELRAEEKTAVAFLKALANKWPRSLWLFVDGDGLYVMDRDAEGEFPRTREGGIDADYIIETIRGIPCDGGEF